MALTKETVVDKIEVLEMGQVQIRTATRVKEDGAVLSSSFSRHVVVPSNKASGAGADKAIRGEEDKAQAACNAT